MISLPSQSISTDNSFIKLMSGIRLNMDSLDISPVEIEDLSFSNFNSDFNYSEGTLKNTKIRFEVKVVLNWQMLYDIQFLEETLDSIDEYGSFDLFDFDTDFVDAEVVRVDAGKMKISMPTLKMNKFRQDKLTTSTNDLSSKITVEEAEMNKIEMDETVITNSSPALFGGTIPIKNPFGPQDMSISNTKMVDFSANKIKMPPFNLTNLHMEGIQVGKVVSDSFIVKASTTKESSEYRLLDLISLSSTMNITVTIKADNVEYSDLSGNIKADKVSLGGMTMDLKLKDIQIRDLRIDGFDIPNIGVGL